MNGKSIKIIVSDASKVIRDIADSNTQSQTSITERQIPIRKKRTSTLNGIRSPLLFQADCQNSRSNSQNPNLKGLPALSSFSMNKVRFCTLPLETLIIKHWKVFLWKPRRTRKLNTLWFTEIPLNLSWMSFSSLRIRLLKNFSRSLQTPYFVRTLRTEYRPRPLDDDF